MVVTAKRLSSVSSLEREASPSDGLERASRERVLGKLGEATKLGSVVREVLGAPSRPAAVARLNEALGDVARELDVGAEVPRTATRVALASAMLFGLVELARRLPEGGAAGMPWALAALAAGISSAAVCLLLGRSAQARARRARDGWDRLSRILTRLLDGSGDVGGTHPVDPAAGHD